MLSVKELPMARLVRFQTAARGFGDNGNTSRLQREDRVSITLTSTLL